MSTTFEVEQKTLEPMRIAGIRMRGKYCECGVAFGKIGKAFGRHICGPGMIFKGNPKKYLTEIQMVLCDE